MMASSVRIIFIGVVFLFVPLFSSARVIPDVDATGSVLGASTQCPNLTRNLSFGSHGSDVVQLQDFLIAQGHLATGNNTGYFRNLTLAAVKQFQCKNMNICSGSAFSNGYGVVGRMTRAKIASVCSSIATPTPPVTQPWQCAIPMCAAMQCPTGQHTVMDTPIYGADGCQSNQCAQRCVSDTVSCTPLPAQTQTLSCLTGQTGSITQTRTSSCTAGATSPTWGGWQMTSNTCYAPVCTTNFHQFTWSTPQSSGGFRAPILLQNGNLLAARTVTNTDGSYSVQAWKSADKGASWTLLSEMAKLNDTNDLGDGAFAQLANGDILYAVRHHNYVCNNWGCQNQGKSPAPNVFRIEVIKSSDGGATWGYHSTVAVSSGTPWGYWSPHLIQLSNGTLQVYYDDEVTPDAQGFTAHQWVTMKTWDGNANTWINPVTVSRAPNSADLSRDGMASVIETSPGHLVVALESVDTASAHKGVVRVVSSDTYGATWSWQSGGRSAVYQPTDHAYNSLQPWLVRAKDNTLMLFLTTDEDRPQPGTPANGAETLDLSVKYLTSTDGGVKWSAPVIVSNNHPSLFPGAVVYADGKVLVQYSANSNYWSVTGTPVTLCTP